MEDLRECQLLENVENKLKYQLFLSRKPDDQLVDRYLNHVNKVILSNSQSHSDQEQTSTFDLTPHPKRNLCYGSLEFNQNIEDEWFIVYILYELSKFDNDLVIEVHDADGDILLIEAADHLPSWLESNKSKNRCFIHKGKLHIIPEHINLKDLQNQYQLKSETSTSITVTQAAAQFVRDLNKATTTTATSSYCKVKTLADSHIQQAIEEQLTGLPDKKVWLSKKFKQLDEIISGNCDQETSFHFSEKFKEKLTLDDVMAMTEEELKISPFSSASSSPKATSSSSSWLTDQQDD